MAKLDYDGPILEIDKLSISFFTRLREIPAVMDFSVTVKPGEAVGLVFSNTIGAAQSISLNFTQREACLSCPSTSSIMMTP